MSTAVFITGHLRTFKTCIHTIKWHVLRRHSPTDFYVCTVRDDQSGDWRELEKLFPGVPVHVRVVGTQPELPEPVETVRFEPFARSVPVQAVLRQLWQLDQAWQHYQEVGKTHDVFVRVRPDLFFHTYHAPAIVCPFDAHTPWFGRFGGINDRFAILGRGASESYFRTFSALDDLMARGCPLHPESLIKASLERGRIAISDRLKTEFSTLRLNGECREPEVSIVDVTHAILA